MKSIVVVGIGFAVGWWLYKAFRDSPPEDEVIRDPSHEFGSSTGI